jgi:hypothetical protein
MLSILLILMSFVLETDIGGDVHTSPRETSSAVSDPQSGLRHILTKQKINFLSLKAMQCKLMVEMTQYDDFNLPKGWPGQTIIHSSTFHLT